MQTFSNIYIIMVCAAGMFFLAHQHPLLKRHNSVEEAQYDYSLKKQKLPSESAVWFALSNMAVIANICHPTTPSCWQPGLKTGFLVFTKPAKNLSGAKD